MSQLGRNRGSARALAWAASIVLAMTSAACDSCSNGTGIDGGADAIVPDVGVDATSADLGEMDLGSRDAGTHCDNIEFDLGACPGSGPLTRGFPGVCNASGSDYCQRLIETETICGGAWFVYSQCMGGAGMGGTCVRATHCNAPDDVNSCGCGTDPACPQGEICVAETADAGPHCACP